MVLIMCNIYMCRILQQSFQVMTLLSWYTGTIFTIFVRPNILLVTIILDLVSYFNLSPPPHLYSITMRIIVSEPYLLESNLAGFTVLFREVITGKLINDKKKVEKIDYLLPKSGTYSLREIAEQCFTEYENLKLESKILTLLDEYERNNPA